MKCLECGHDLKEMRRELIGFVTSETQRSEYWEDWKYSCTEHAGHCENCLSAWQWTETFEDGKFTTTQPERIFWG